MDGFSWSPTGAGTASEDQDSGLWKLESHTTSGYNRFDGTPRPEVGSFDLQLTMPERKHYFALYITVRTSAGRRVFKLQPNDSGPRLRFGYRYEIGLGRAMRGGGPIDVTVDMVAIANELEPGITIQSLTAFYVRVRGTLHIASGETDPDPDPDPDPDGEISRVDAVRFLTQATFGASEATIAAIRSGGSYSTWIDGQLAMPFTESLPPTQALGHASDPVERHIVWWRHAMEADDQLKQRLAFAWSQVFVVSDLDYELANSRWAMCDYYDMLGRGATGTFRDLLEGVALHPVMGVYLSMLRNEKADPARNVRPDENFAREVMQLFTIGLHEVRSDGTVVTQNGQPKPAYDQHTVEALARVFTGWNYQDHGWTDNSIDETVKRRPMVPHEEYHDRDSKDLFGTTLPANRSAGDELRAALDVLVDHQNVGPFISRLLIQRLVTSNPTPAYIGRMAAVFADNGSGVRGDLAALTKAILLDPEARNGHRTVPDGFGKLKEPILRLTQLWRALDAAVGPDSNKNAWRVYDAHPEAMKDLLGQAPMEARSVFNFYLPSFPMEGSDSLVAPEHQIMTEVNIASTNNMLFTQIYDFHNYRTDSNASGVARINVDRALGLVDDPNALVGYLNTLLTADQLPAAAASAIAAQVASHDGADSETKLNATLDAIYCVAASPFHLVQK